MLKLDRIARKSIALPCQRQLRQKMVGIWNLQMAPPQRISLKAVRFVLAAQSDHVTFGIYAGPLPAAQLPFLFSRSTDD